MAALQGKIAVFTRLHDAVATAAVDELKKANAAVADVQVVSVPEGADVASAAAALGAKAGMFDGVVAANEEISLLSTELHALIPLIKSGGELQVYVADADDEKKVSARGFVLEVTVHRLMKNCFGCGQNSILMAMMIGGVVETEESEASSAFFPELAAARCFSSKKPAFEAGSSAAISLTKKPTTTAQPLKK